MNQRINQLLDYYIRDKSHHRYRKPGPEDPYTLAGQFEKEGLSDVQRSIRRLQYILEQETPVVFREDKIVLMRTVTGLPELYTSKEWNAIKEIHYIHEQGKICNINPDYSSLIDAGFDQKRKEIAEARLDVSTGEDEQAEAYLDALLETLDKIEEFAGRYARAAKEAGNERMAGILQKIPAHKPESFQEALQFFRLIHYCLWCSFNYHNTIGRFDQYMYPYLKADLEKGVLDQDSALELLEEFFISFNIDSDLYTGMQQGDNGQSMVLGGQDQNGKDLFNELSELCIQASLELKLIDPKINLRVCNDTPLSRYERGTELTKQGLGFPQYCNDEVVIPALLRWGYDEADAYNYVVAACWEFIIPGKGMDIPNIDGLSFAQVISSCTELLPRCRDFSEFQKEVKSCIRQNIQKMTAKYQNIYLEPSPLMSLMMDGCIQQGKDVSRGCKYNNYGIHGSGISTGADSLAAVKRFVFEEKSITAMELTEALQTNFKGKENLRNRLRYEGPKMGNDDDAADSQAVWLLDCFADSLEGIVNDRGGIYRAGTGSAMYYIWHSSNLQATPDGRDAGEEFACNYSPSLFARCEGPVSVIKSFAKPDLVKVSNGGPLTIELYDRLFRNDDSIRKVAMFVKSFMDMGGHQMQINAVNREKLIDAKAHPENYRNLIVRVWGWSGYFVELDEVYQDQIIKRMELMVE
ncbi:pyruvate formate lyase family protein [Robinsoniella peoriensis]|uniref:pyruvate formate lyase family protein n=1 Tax=Robinsoniella peoriensis TaxID=180332 RepID=UPI0005C7C956|nr:pyruvate formate lyase family protein [Robinsoniella peoriensis]